MKGRTVNFVAPSRLLPESVRGRALREEPACDHFGQGTTVGTMAEKVLR